MATPGASAPLQQQHQDIDFGVQGAMDGSSDQVELARSLELLRTHLYLEEAVLFPALEGSVGLSIMVMEREHGLMWPLMESLAQACRDGASLESMQDELDELFQLLQVHNPKEEQILYSVADEHAGLAEALAAAQVPEGWACKAVARARG
ncbi:hemerythrin domain-containing protein [Comamonas sp. NLF-1-9]|uniref:hemerythrin domain-containing protein n=1 Tax=Comamonas sp. NLF-1-9 TaxID=2853163 RepID=UPI001C44AE86|nr:hemerythrin domain-containing protein [Comamonas sp. NLF-1-9]QXL84772.1 hemerythrin domain-containing protein [Comamonas sp. NLF-1-9]